MAETIQVLQERGLKTIGHLLIECNHQYTQNEERLEEVVLSSNFLQDIETNRKAYPFFPYFKVNVLAQATIHLPKSEGSSVSLGTGNSVLHESPSGKTAVIIEPPSDLYYFARLFGQGLPTNEIRVNSAYVVQANFNNYHLIARIGSDDPNAENFIRKFIETAHDNARLYLSLENLFKATDRKGRPLYEDEQSLRYKTARYFAHRHMYKALKRICDNHGVECITTNRR